jgi:DNA polymerase V
MSVTTTPLFSSKVAAGFPSPADDYIERDLSLDEHLIRNRIATFFVHVKGDSMRDAGIQDGNLLVVDKSITPKHGSIVVAEVNREMTVKRLYKRRGEIKLQAANPAYPDIPIQPEGEVVIWGVVTHAIHSFR